MQGWAYCCFENSVPGSAGVLAGIYAAETAALQSRHTFSCIIGCDIGACGTAPQMDCAYSTVTLLARFLG
jgi:hypothetical protein